MAMVAGFLQALEPNLGSSSARPLRPPSPSGRLARRASWGRRIRAARPKTTLNGALLPGRAARNRPPGGGGPARGCRD